MIKYNIQNWDHDNLYKNNIDKFGTNIGNYCHIIQQIILIKNNIN